MINFKYDPVFNCLIKLNKDIEESTFQLDNVDLDELQFVLLQIKERKRNDTSTSS